MGYRVKSARPFPLDALPRVSRAAVEAARWVQTFDPFGSDLHREVIERVLGGPLSLGWTETILLEAHQLSDHFHPQSVVCALSTIEAPVRRTWVAFDAVLAVALSRQLLGLSLDELLAPRPLTLAEQGAFEFLVRAWSGGDVQLRRNLDDLHGRFLLARGRIESPVATGSLHLIIPESLRLASPSGYRPLAVSKRQQLHSMVWEMVVEGGRVMLSSAELQGLAAGDVVLTGQQKAAACVWLRVGDLVWIAQLLDTNAFLSSREQGGAPMAVSEALDSRLSTLDSLPIEVVCEVARIRLAGRELVELAPGAVVPVGRPLSGAVDLTVGGRLFARGELVDVEGEIGVRVIEICSAG